MLMDSVRRWIRFNWWYYRHPPWDTGLSPPELYAFLRQHPPGMALDLGCGTGVNLVTLARHGWRAIGVDYALPAVWRAWRRLRRERLPGRVRVGDVTRLWWLGAPFDLILDIGCFHSLDRAGRMAYLAHAQRLLASGGAWLLYAHLVPPSEPAGADGRGLSHAEIDDLSRRLRLILREDGLDHDRPSAWFTFEKP
jgi:SAM-dependent methyltransferase